MKEILLTRLEFEELRRLQVKHRWDWPAVFSTNAYGEIWPFSTYGYTHGKDREPVQGLNRTIDEVAKEYAQYRPDCGRFFISEKGAFYRNPDDAKDIQFVVIRICE